MSVVRRIVQVEVEGIQKDTEGEENSIKSECPGIYCEQPGKRFLLYEEHMEGTDSVTKNLVNIGISEISVAKTGAVNAKMNFISGKKTVFNYHTTYGKLQMEANTRNLMLESNDKYIRILIDYNLEVSGDVISECKIIIKATFQ